MKNDRANRLANKEVSEVETDITFMKLSYYRKLLLAMQCADMGVVNQKTYDYVVKQIEQLQNEVGNFWEEMELIG